MGVETNTAKPSIKRLPTMALRKPPPSVPGAGVSWVNMFRSTADRPFLKRMNKIHSRTAMPSTMAPMESARPMLLATCRRRYRLLLTMVMCVPRSSAFGLFRPDDQHLGQRQHHKGDNEQQETQGEQGGEVEIGGLAKLVGQGGRDGGAR